jgi:hypothetical protein
VSCRWVDGLIASKLAPTGFSGGRREGEHPRNNKAPAFLRGLRFVWCGTRRTVAVGGARFSASLERVGKFGVPQLVTIYKSASYGFQWNRTGIFWEAAECCRAPNSNVVTYEMYPASGNRLQAI